MDYKNLEDLEKIIKEHKKIISKEEQKNKLTTKDYYLYYREKNKNRLKGYSEWYRENNKEKIASYYQNNKKKIAEANKKWADNNKDKIKGYASEYYAKNRESITAKQRLKREKDRLLKEKLEIELNEVNKKLKAKENAKTYYEKNKEKIKAYSKQYAKSKKDLYFSLLDLSDKCVSAFIAIVLILVGFILSRFYY